MADSPAVPIPSTGQLRLIPRSDARLAKLAAAGDERAFATIYQRYHQEIYRYCRAILGDADEAQDALQSTMASALCALPGESREVQLRPWLYRVARNESVSLLRRRQPLSEDHEAHPEPEPAADVAFEARERLRALMADLAALPERQRSALVMRELSGLSHEEIAAALAVSGGAARQLVYEARVALQELEEGRAMGCERVRQALSDRDGRVLRGRRLRAHLRGCQGCSDFKRGIETRTADLELLAPPLSAVAASSVLAAVAGGGSSTAGAGALVAGGVGGSAAGAKALGLIAASAAIGIGAGTVGGVDLPGLGSGSGEPGSRADSAPPAAIIEQPATGKVPDGAGDGASRADDRGGASSRSDRAADRRQNGKDKGAEPGSPAAANSAAGGASTAAPAGGGQPETPPGSAVATDRSGGEAATPTTGRPDHAGQGLPAHANPGGKSAEHRIPPK